MATQCTLAQLHFHPLERRNVIGRFDGDRLTSDGGAILLREVGRRCGDLPAGSKFPDCGTDPFNPA